MIQVVSPNLNATGTVGMCLEYASRGVFKNPAPGTTAWNAWNVAQQHKDQNFPQGVYFPIWFSFYTTINGVYGNFGHVAVMTPSGQIYSSPWQVGTGYAVLPNIPELIRIYSNAGQSPMAYAGWSPDILGLTVIKQGGIMPTDAQIDNFISYTYYDGYGKAASPAVFDDWRKILKNNYVEGTISIAEGIDGDPAALKNKPNVPTSVVPYSGPPLFVQKV